jgi:uncharacterized Zn finger protein
MTESIVAQEYATLIAALRRAAGEAATPATLRQIAQSMEYVATGTALYAAGMVTPICRTPTGLIVAAHVAGDTGRATVVTGIKRAQTRWSCSCAAATLAWAGVCPHMVAVKLAIAVEAAADRHRECAERRRLISEYMMDMGAKKTLLERAQATERAAQDAYDTARAAYENLIAQLNVDDAQARAELAWSESSAPTVTPLREAA